jgi:hypothetical protein
MLAHMLGGRTYRSSARMARLAVISFSFFALAAPAAHATLRVWNYNDPTGDPTPTNYQLIRVSDQFTFPFTLGEGVDRSFGVAPKPDGTPESYVIQALPSTGWHVADIKCVGRGFPGEFTIDIPNGRVTAVHQDKTHEQTCTFTNSNAPPGSVQAGSGTSGVSPSVPSSEISRVTLPKGPAVVHVSAGRGFATAKVRLSRRSVVRCQLMRGKRVLASKRVTHSAGTYPCTVRLGSRTRRALRAQGLKKTTLTLKVVVAADKATHVFRYRVIVKL